MIKRIELEDIMKNINYDLLKLTKKYGNELVLGRGKDCNIMHSIKGSGEDSLKGDKSKFSMLENHALITQKNTGFFIKRLLKRNPIEIFREGDAIRLSTQFQEELLINNDKIYLGVYGPIKFKEYYDFGEFE
ncbi:MAG: hypothetical protein KJ646_05540 [Nanoarchaeota archaeon]|nr:hypothetical protein [Nanoarchaeota archaeon]